MMRIEKQRVLMCHKRFCTENSFDLRVSATTNTFKSNCRNLNIRMKLREEKPKSIPKNRGKNSEQK